ncbi:MAG: glycosyltransferase family 2 protein [Patescibacteria group bacterium]
MDKISLILASFRRPELLNLGLFSISKYSNSRQFPLEIIVVNDGIEDETENVCKKYNDKLDIKYYFSGQRNINGIKSRCPAWALNIGVKKAQGDIIVLSCPEIWHLNYSLSYIVFPLLNTEDRIMTTPKFMYFDDNNYLLPFLLKDKNITITSDILNNLVVGGKGTTAVRMPFLLGMYKKEFMDVGGYDERFIGYAGDDNDFCTRLDKNGLKLIHTDAQIIHLYHEGTNDGKKHPENSAWLYNYNLWKNNKETAANQNIGWGKLDEY